MELERGSWGVPGSSFVSVMGGGMSPVLGGNHLGSMGVNGRPYPPMIPSSQQQNFFDNREHNQANDMSNINLSGILSNSQQFIPLSMNGLSQLRAKSFHEFPVTQSSPASFSIPNNSFALDLSGQPQDSSSVSPNSPPRGTKKKLPNRKYASSLSYRPAEILDIRVITLSNKLYPTETGPKDPRGNFAYTCHLLSRNVIKGKQETLTIRPAFRQQSVEISADQVIEDISLSEAMSKLSENIFLSPSITTSDVLHIITPPWCISSTNMTRIYVREMPFFCHPQSPFRVTMDSGRELLIIHVKVTDEEQVNLLLQRINNGKDQKKKSVRFEPRMIEDDPSAGEFTRICVEKEDLQAILIATWEIGIDLDPIQFEIKKFGISLVAKTSGSELTWRHLAQQYLSEQVGEEKIPSLTEKDWLEGILPTLVTPFRYHLAVELIRRQILSPVQLSQVGEALSYRLSTDQAVQFLDCAYLLNAYNTVDDSNFTEKLQPWADVLSCLSVYWAPMGVQAVEKRIYRTTGMHASSTDESASEASSKRRRFNKPRPLSPHSFTCDKGSFKTWKEASKFYSTFKVANKHK